MRLWLTLCLALVSCSGGVTASLGGEASGTLETGPGGAVATAGAPAEAPGSGVQQRQGGDAGAPVAAAGVAGAGLSDGGTSGESSGDGGASGAAQGDGGAPPAPDDTGCAERPWVGTLDDARQVSGLDCSSCSNGSELGYETPGFCDAAKSCLASPDVTTLGASDVFLLLPPASEQGGSACQEQACKGASGGAVVYPDFVGQLWLTVPTGHTIKVEVDEHRRVLKRDEPLLSCTEVSNCFAFGSQSQIAIVVEPGAARGWARIRVDFGETCH